MNHFFSNNSLLSLSKEPKILTWDASGSAPLDDGTGSWNFSGGTNWLYGSYYGSWIADSVAVFGVNNGTAGIIILDGLQPIPVKKIIFNSAGSGNYTLSGGTINLRGTNPTIENNVGATINSTLDGSNGLIKSGSGTLTLSGLNTYIGVTYIYAGSITFDSFGVSATTSEFNISSGANLRFNIVLAQEINTRITGDGSLIKGSSGELVLTNGLNNYSGGTTVVDNGRLTITTNGCLGSGSLNLQSSRNDAVTTLLMNGSQTIHNNINILTTTGRNNLESKNGNVTITGNIVITGSSTNAVVYLSNTSGYNLTISGNISGTTTSTQSFRGAIGSTGTISGTVNIPNGVFNVDNNGSWTINSSGHTYLSTFFLNNGKFILGINNALCTTARLVWGGTSATNYGICDLNGYNQTVTGLESTLTVNGKITNNSLSSNSILTLSGLTTNYTYNSTITDGTSRNIALVMNSAGRTQNLGGANTYSGGTTINGGIIRITNANALGTGTVTINSGGTLNLNGLTISNTIVNNGGTVIP